MRGWLLLAATGGCADLAYEERPPPDLPVTGLAGLCEPTLTCDDEGLAVVVGADREGRSARLWLVPEGAPAEEHTLTEVDEASCGVVSWVRPLARGDAYVADVATALPCDVGVVIAIFDGAQRAVGCVAFGVDPERAAERDDAPWWLPPLVALCEA